MKNKLLKRIVLMCAVILSLNLLGACGHEKETSYISESLIENLVLSDAEITINGENVSSNSEDAVYVSNDIIYYESGKDFTYGEGSEKDGHSKEEADAHTVVHITKPGTYSINGVLSKGQIAIDLGEDAKDKPEAVVTLILNGVDITCEVAPAIIFYNVYECGNADTQTATKDVDTSMAGANVIIADETTNTVNGSYVARIYKPESVVLNEDGTAVEDAKKLHKYDAAFYSKMTMNINCEEKGTGILNINADNEGLDSELHLTINGGNINIYSGNDGINTNEDGVSVTTINDGTLTIKVTGETGEGDGIDSNGWLVINDGTVIASACSNSADAGIDSDMGIHINGGTVIASGHMLDRIEDGSQTYAVFNFMQGQDGSEVVMLKDENDVAVFEMCPENSCSILVYSSSDLSEGTYSLWSDENQLAVQFGGNMMGGFGMQMMPGDQIPPEEDKLPEGQMPFGEDKLPKGQMPFEEGGMPKGGMPPGGMKRPEGGMPFGDMASELSTEFEIKAGANNFMVSAQIEK